jgi:hypothetical protein
MKKMAVFTEKELLYTVAFLVSINSYLSPAANIMRPWDIVGCFQFISIRKFTI